MDDPTGLSDPTLELLCQRELPLTRSIGLAYPDLVEWTAELDSLLPACLQSGWDWEEQGLELPSSNPQPDGSSRQMTAMEQAMYEESQARIQPLIDAMAPDPGFTYGDLYQ